MRRAAAGWNRSGMVWLLLSVSLLWLSGLGIHLWPAPDDLLELPAWAEGLRHVTVVVHGVMAWVICLLVGRWVWPHVGLVWQRKSHATAWALGLLTALAGAFVAVGGLYLLYGSAPLRDTLGILHWWVGLVWPLPLGLHIARRWRRRVGG